MGINRKRREAFFKSHPFCCFCGGLTPATTEDHFPSRAIFTNRQWPVGYVFPACALCQSYSVADEVLVKLITRSTASMADEQSERDFTNSVNAVAAMFPDVFRSLILSTNKKRASLRTHKMKVPPGTTVASLPLISLSHPRIHEAIDRFANKLFCALYYMHTGEILRLEGKIFYHWHTNAQIKEIEILQQELLKHLPVKADLARGKIPLNDQFRYQYVTNSGAQFAGFLAAFHQSFIIGGYIFGNLPNQDAPEGTKLLRPLCHEK